MPTLTTRLIARIREEGPLRFPDFMAAALYDPREGYYARGSRQVGREGDFFTSVSVGSLFGRLLATRIQAWHEETGRPGRWRIVEVGAHDATLATDVLDFFAGTPAIDGLEYAIIEPLGSLAEIQRQRLAGRPAVVHPDVSPLAAAPLPTFLIANEVLDALPFHVIGSDGTSWREFGVGLDENDSFCWRELDGFQDGPEIRPAGYRTEVRTNYESFFRELASCLSRGRMLWIDYGFPHDDYYHPSRTEGTLRTFRNHRAGDDPLVDPGEQDITAHVDFTAAARALRAAGGTLTAFEDQARFLTRLAGPWLLSLEGRRDEETRKALRSFQTLVHPAHLGSKFHFLEAAWGEGSIDDSAVWTRLLPG